MLDAEPAVTAFQKWAKDRGWTQEELAYECDCNRSNISLVLSGKRPGRYTWRRMVRVLPEGGLLLLQQCSAWNKHAVEALKRRREREARLAAALRDQEQLAQLVARLRQPTELVHA